jgi:hypothetical protein
MQTWIQLEYIHSSASTTLRLQINSTALSKYILDTIANETKSFGLAVSCSKTRFSISVGNGTDFFVFAVFKLVVPGDVARWVVLLIVVMAEVEGVVEGLVAVEQGCGTTLGTEKIDS